MPSAVLLWLSIELPISLSLNLSKLRLEVPVFTTSPVVGLVSFELKPDMANSSPLSDSEETSVSVSCSASLEVFRSCVKPPDDWLTSSPTSSLVSVENPVYSSPTSLHMDSMPDPVGWPSGADVIENGPDI